MARPFNPAHNRGAGLDPPRENPPSNNLWIGNVSPDVSEAELKSVFEKHGNIDSVSTYPTRNYAFICFKDVEGAKSARQGLQGMVIHGNSLKIQFAKPAKPCKSLWVAGISPSISKDELEKEFLRYGKLQEFRFLKDRNTAFVDYVGLENATEALKNMNGKRIGGSQIRVDFLRSQSSKKEMGPDAKEGQFPRRNVGPSDIRWMGQDSMNNFPEHSLYGPTNRTNQFFPMGPQFGDGLPTKVLWIKHPPSVIVEEDMLHNAMILFGEIERIKTFSDRNYAFVEFRSVEEARHAKEGLQGKLFNDPRILIDYFSDEFPGVRGLAGEHPFQPFHMDVHGLNRPVLLGNNPGRPSSFGIHGPEPYMRPPPVGPNSTFESAHHGPEFVDLAAVHNLQNHSPRTQLGGPAWRRSPGPGLASSPSAGFNVPSKLASSAWDVFDGNQRESKRSRFDAALSERIENQGEQYRPHSVRGGGASGSLTRGSVVGLGQRQVESDCIWRGLIAKGGTPVCRARCVPVGEGLGADIPDVVNCSARTGLDLLGKHYDDAIGFGIVSFLPDSEEDFASYTEFLKYLGSKDRAGVAKFDDGTTLFLVPPSDFLANVLDVHGPPRLYGVVLKFPQVAPSSPALNPQSIPSGYADPLKMPTLQKGYADPPRMPTLQGGYADQPKMPTFQRGYGANTPEERGIHLDNSRVLPEDYKLPPKAPVPVTSSFSGHVDPPTTGTSQAGLALTPELIATLTSLLPANNGSSGPQTSLVPHAPSVSSGVDTNFAHWKHENQAPDHNGQFLQQWGGQINSQQHQQNAPIVSSTTSQFHQTMNPYDQFNDHRNNFSPQGARSSGPMAPVNPLQSGPGMNQHYQQRSSQDIFRGQMFDNVTDSPRSYNPSIHQQPPAYHVSSSNQMHANAGHVPQPYIPQSSEVDPTNRSQPLQTAPFGGTTQENVETEADKNERYKTTLLFAANLLSRIHQPSGNQPGQDAGSH